MLVSFAVALGPLVWLWHRWDRTDAAIVKHLPPERRPFWPDAAERRKRWMIGLSVFAASVLLASFFYPDR